MTGTKSTRDGVDRRTLLKYATGLTAVGGTGLAGCLGGDGGDGDDGDDGGDGGNGGDGGDGSSDEYPSDDIRHIVPWDSGGGTDTVMRSFVDYAEEHLPVSIYTENISGATSGTGVHTLMGAEPDGYTVGTLTWDSVVTVPFFGLVEGYDLENLQFVCTVTEHATLIAAHENTPYESLDDLVDAAEDQPGEISISNVGEGGVWHLPAADFEQKAGVEFHHVPFPDGAGAQREAFVSEEVPVACTSYAGILPAIDEARILGVMGEERMEELPDTPTFLEQDYDVTWGSFRAMAVPDGTDADRIDTLEGAFEEAAHDEEFQEWLSESGGGGWMWRNSEDAESYLLGLQENAMDLLEQLAEDGVIDA